MKQLSNVEISKMRQLADFLETVPAEDFDLSLWVSQEEMPPKLAFFGLIERDPGCGFAGCAIGWAAHSGLFPGLRLSRRKDDDKLTPQYGGATEWRAVAKLLGISERASEFLFSIDMYADDPEPADVCQRLRRYADIVEARLARKLDRPALRVVA